MAEGFQVNLSTFWGIYYWCLSNIFWLRRKDKKDLNDIVAEICILVLTWKKNLFWAANRYSFQFAEFTNKLDSFPFMPLSCNRPPVILSTGLLLQREGARTRARECKRETRNYF